MSATRIPVICESCFMAYQDIDPDDAAETVEVAAQFMSDFGADVPDHVCDATDSGSMVRRAAHSRRSISLAALISISVSLA